MSNETTALRADYDLQAEIFGTYLIPGATITPQIKQLFAKTMQATEAPLSDTDAKLLDAVLDHPGRLRYLDAGAALLYPDAEIRRRLYVMFATLEANTEYWDEFLPKKRSPLYLFTIAGAGIRGVWRAIAGLILIKAGL